VRIASGAARAVESPNGSTLAMVTTPQGMLAVGGDFSAIGGVPSGGFAAWRNAPTISIVSNSASVDVCDGHAAQLEVSCRSESPMSYQWTRNGIPVLPPDDDSVRGERTPSLTMTPALPGVYSCIVTNQCEQVTTPSIVVAVVLPPACSADFNADGGVDGRDVEAFMLRWQLSTCDADVNLDGGIDGADVEWFFIAWQAGGC
jgi:hypothetical protein